MEVSDWKAGKQGTARTAQPLRRAGAGEKPQQHTGGQAAGTVAERPAARRWGSDGLKAAKAPLSPSRSAQWISNKFMTYYEQEEKYNLIATWQHVPAINIKVLFSNKEKAA